MRVSKLETATALNEIVKACDYRDDIWKALIKVGQHSYDKGYNEGVLRTGIGACIAAIILGIYFGHKDAKLKDEHAKEIEKLTK